MHGDSIFFEFRNIRVIGGTFCYDMCFITEFGGRNTHIRYRSPHMIGRLSIIYYVTNGDEFLFRHDFYERPNFIITPMATETFSYDEVIISLTFSTVLATMN